MKTYLFFVMILFLAIIGCIQNPSNSESAGSVDTVYNNMVVIQDADVQIVYGTFDSSYYDTGLCDYYTGWNELLQFGCRQFCKMWLPGADSNSTVISLQTSCELYRQDSVVQVDFVESLNYVDYYIIEEDGKYYLAFLCLNPMEMDCSTVYNKFVGKKYILKYLI